MLCWQWNGRGGGYCVQITTPLTPRYSPLGKPDHQADRPTGTTKQLIFGWGAFFFFCLRLAPFEPQQSSRSNRAAATSRTTTKMSPYFGIVRCHYYRILLLQYPLNYVLQCLLFCYFWRLCMAINTSAQHNDGLLPDIIMLT